MANLVYATPGINSPSAGGVGWVDFGNFTINPGDSITGITANFLDGSTVTFDLKNTAIVGAGRSFVATQPPAYSFAPFGNTGYTGINGNVVLYEPNIAVSNLVTSLTFSNIIIKDINGNIIPNYSLVAADGEITNVGEIIEYVTDGAPWDLLINLPPVGGGPIQTPVISGIGTNTFTETGVVGNGVSGPVITTVSPKTVTVTFTSSSIGGGGREGVAIGFAINKVTVKKNVAGRINAADQFELQINGTPSNSVITTGNLTGIQNETANVFGVIGNTYTINEAMAPGSISALTDYIQTVTVTNLANGGQIPPITVLPETVTLNLGDVIEYTITNTPKSADISVVKTESPNPVIAGNTITYTMTVANAGPNDAQSVILTDTLPPCILNPMYSINGGTQNPWTGNVNLGNIAANGSPITVVITGIVDPACNQASLTNTATVSSPTPDPNPNNNTSTIITNVNQSADISIVKTASPIYLDRGNTIVYTLVIKNNGVSDAQGVTLTDTIPAEILNPEFSLNNGVTWNLWISPYSLGLLTAGSTVTILIRGTISSVAKGAIDNTAIVSSPTPDPDPNNNTSTITVNVNYADLTAPGNFVKAVDKVYADVGDELTYTITVKNTGNTIANNVVITDPIPNGTSYVPGSLTANASVTGTPATGISVTNGIAPGATLVLSYKVKVNMIPNINPIPNTATVKYTYTVNPGNPNGATGSGNTNTVTTQINHGEILPQNAVKSADKATTTPGDIITYTITGKNTGNVPINVAINDAIPAGTSFVQGSVVINNISKPNENPAIGINVGTVAINGIFIVTFKVKVLQNALGQIINKANIDYSYIVDPNKPPITNTIETNEVITTVLKASLAINKSANRSGAVIGDIIRYSIVVTNNGEINLNNIQIQDSLVPELQYADNLTIDGVSSNQSIITGVNLGTILVGASKIISFDAKVIAVPLNKVIINSSTGTFNYTVSGNIFNGTTTSNKVNITIYSPVMEVTKKANKESVKVGDIFQYIINITNSGDINLQNVIAQDTLPIEFKVLDIKVDGVSINGDIEAGINIGAISVGQNKEVVLTINVIADLNEIYKNVAKITAEVVTDPNNPPKIIQEQGVDNLGVKVYNPNLLLIKSADKEYAVVGDVVTYTIVAKNIGDITLGNIALDPVFISDILSSSLEFVAGSMTVNGVQDPLSSIVNGVDLGQLAIGESKTITFKAKVLSADISPIQNNSIATYGYQLPGEDPETGTSTSNTVNLIPEVAEIDIVKSADKDFVVLGDTITYTVTLKNTGTLDAFNVIFKDELPVEVELIDGSFSINGIVVNGVNLNKGVNIGTIKKNSQTVVKYAVKVVKANCELKIINKASVKFSYRLLDGTMGLYESESSSATITIGINTFKQISIEEELIIPTIKPDIEEIGEVTAEIEIVNCHIIKTPVLISNEGQNLTGYKLIIHGNITEVVEYTALDPEQSVHSAHYTIPFTAFIVLPINYCIGKIDIDSVIEDVYFKELDARTLFTNITVLLKANVCICEK